MASEDGLNFPKDAQGKISTTIVNQGAFAACIEKVDADAHAKVTGEKKWRFGYAKHVVKQVEIAAKSPENALKVAQDGLDYLHKSFTFTRGDETMPLADAMKKFKDPQFKTATVEGTKKITDASMELEVPYHGKTLRGAELKSVVEGWVQRGVIELDTGSALCLVSDTPKWRDLSDMTFVLFGAGSAMGPFPILMALGAHVVAIDLDRKGIWDRLIATAKDSPGTLTFPITDSFGDNVVPPDGALAAAAGCNMLTQAPEIRTWLTGLFPDKQLVCGAYAYLDGPLFVRVSMAMDAIIQDLVKERKVKPALAYLCTPTDAHVCTTTSKEAAAQNLRKAPWWMGLLAMGFNIAMPKMAMLKNQVRTEGLPIVDAIVKEQGPNYILAKRLQHWRSVVSRNQGCIVSTNIAPSTATVSVVSNKNFAMAYKAMHHFRPMEVFQPETSNAVMSALLINDLRNPYSAANPETKLENPMQLFTATSFHGGAWRTGYKFGCIGPPSVVAYLILQYIVTGYLALYSFGQCAGWSAASWTLLQHAMGNSAAKTLWAAGGAQVTYFTYLQGLEVLHSILGMVRSPAASTAVQIGSRIALVQVLNCHDVSASPDSALWPKMLCFAWCITEIVRYLFYGLSTLGVKIPPLTWLRYSTFLPLYPIGVSGELGCIYYAAPKCVTEAACQACGFFAQMVFKTGFKGMFAVYVACFPMLYSYMLAQRKKAVGGGRGKAKKE